jgi:hypothetical protein
VVKEQGGVELSIVCPQVLVLGDKLLVGYGQMIRGRGKILGFLKVTMTEKIIFSGALTLKKCV